MLRGTVAEIILAGRCYLQMLEQYEPYFRRLKQSLKSLYFPPRIPDTAYRLLALLGFGTDRLRYSVKVCDE